MSLQPGAKPDTKRSFWHIFWIFLKLGLTSFGGPIAHLGYFHKELVEKRKWLSAHNYADLVALCQFLPGPASSQTGMGLGILQGGVKGGFAAWLGFTTPSAVALMAFAVGLHHVAGALDDGWLRGLKIVAVAVVADALWAMARKLTPDRTRVTIALLAAATTLLLPYGWMQLLLIALGAALGVLALRLELPPLSDTAFFQVSKRLGVASLVLFFSLLALLPVLRALTHSLPLAVFDAFYRTGALVFGGGHVVLPLLQAEVVPSGWVNGPTFIAGYGAAQAVPGPLFTFSAFLGAALGQAQGSLGAALGYGCLALIGIFLPSFLLLFGVLPFWDVLRQKDFVRYALLGVNAVVVGILLAALYTPVWTSAIAQPTDAALSLCAFLLLHVWKVSAWQVVLLCALSGALFL